MHIKQVVIEGFKSYKNQTIIEPFSRHINVVVGANGSGKSNFFHAIRFVLNDVSSSISQQERQKLMHEGAGNAVMSAYVEIVFDNADQRLPFDRDEVRLRRTIGKNDEYTVDRKKITKTEVTNLLESAGFSRANPYYVVQQGKITKLSLIKDHERLELLKEIGGTAVYEERRKASEKLLREADGRRLRITEMMETMGEKLTELEEERAELEKFNQADRTRRALQFTLWDADLATTQASLAQLQEECDSGGAVTEDAEALVAAARNDLSQLEQTLKSIAGQAVELAESQKHALKEKKQAEKKSVTAEFDLKDMHGRVASSANTQKQRRKDLAEVEKEIAGKRRQLEEARQQGEQPAAEEAALGAQLAELERRQNALHAIQGRKAQFANAAERDTYLEGEMAALQESLVSAEELRQQVLEQAAGLNTEAMDLSSSIGDQEATIRQQEEAIKRCDADLQAAHAQRNAMQDRRRELFKAEDSARGKVERLQQEYQQSLRARSSAVPRHLAGSLDAMERICKDHGITGVLGPLVDLFTCNENLYSAVEVTAGGALFHMVVDTDATASRIIHQLAANKAGRITCLPLNRLNPEKVKLPSQDQYDRNAVPLLKKLTFEAIYRPAMEQVFGKTMVCRNMDVAAQVAREASVNCVTMDGDEVRKKGTLAGGYRDPDRSKMHAAKRYKAVQLELSAAQSDLDRYSEELQEVDQAITVLRGNMQTLEAKQARLKESLLLQRSTLRGTAASVEEVQGRSTAKETEIAKLEETKAAMAIKLTDMKAELGMALQGALTPEQGAQLSALGPEIVQAQVRLTEVRLRVGAVEGDIELLETVMKENLLPRRTELIAAIETAEAAVSDEATFAAESKAQDASKAARDAAEEALRIDTALASALQQGADIRAQLEALQEEVVKKEQAAMDESTARGRLQAKVAALEQRRDDLERHIRELGTLPADAFQTYSGRSSKQLNKLLDKANTELKKYTHVNKKALDQWAEITEDRDNLTRRHAESEGAYNKIKTMITQLDMRKDELIERTFKGVAKNFKDIFAQLAPGGSGQLVMQKRMRQPEPSEDADEDAGGETSTTSDRYSGVKVKVSFSGNEVMTMKQLSGGQKTLVALALIFAIQRCDPAPFYLFDEIDAALDPQYRETVAKMLAEQTASEDSPSQFIITTFHPQVIRRADKVYGVSHTHRISKVDVVTHEDALAFVQSADQDENGAANMDES